VSDATLESIEAALFTKLLTLKPGTFKCVGRFDGDATQEALAQACNGVTPAALLSCESDEPIAGTAVETLVQGTVGQESRATWRVLVILEEPRGDAQAVQTVGTKPGFLALQKAVREALAGLEIEGLTGDGVATYAGSRRTRTDHGMLYVRELRFRTDYPSDPAEPAITGAPLDRIDADLNLVGEAETPPNPLATFRAQF
jgi:hypothetical protein